MRNLSIMAVILLLVVSTLSMTAIAREDGSGTDNAARDDTAKPTDTPEPALLAQGQILRTQLAEQIRTRLANLGEADQAKLRLMTQDRLQQMTGLSDAQIQQRLQQMHVEDYDPAVGFKARVLAQQRVQALQQERTQLQQEETQLGEQVRNTVQAFNQLKQQYQDCEGDESAECDQVRADTIEKAKEHLADHADLQITILEKFKTSVEENEYIDQDRADAILSEIDDRIQTLEDLKSQVDAATTKDELQALGEDVYGNLNQWRNTLRVREVQMDFASFAGILQQAEQLEVKLDGVLSRMEDQGVDTSNVQDAVDAFREHIATARDDYQAAEEKLQAAFDERSADEPDLEQIQSLNDEAHSLIGDAKDELGAARDELGTLWDSLKDSRSDLSFSKSDKIVKEEDELDDYDNEIEDDAEGEE